MDRPFFAFVSAAVSVTAADVTDRINLPSSNSVPHRPVSLCWVWGVLADLMCRRPARPVARGRWFHWP